MSSQFVKMIRQLQSYVYYLRQESRSKRGYSIEHLKVFGIIFLNLSGYERTNRD